MMSLTTHPYHYFTDEASFRRAWSETLHKLNGERLLHVYGVWDRLEQRWFADAPMLIELSAGVLSVKVSCEGKLALGWNDIMPTEKPIWFDETQRCGELAGLDWQEDLIWCEYDAVRGALGQSMRGTDVQVNRGGLSGIVFRLDGGDLLYITDAGDEIEGRLEYR